MEVKSGGQWRFIQQDPEGNTYGFRGVYHLAKSPELLIYTMEWDELPDHVLMNIDRFEERDGKAICTSRSIFETDEDRDGMIQTGMEEIQAASIQYVRKISGYRKPSKVNEAAFNAAVAEIAAISGRLLVSLETSAPLRERLQGANVHKEN